MRRTATLLLSALALSLLPGCLIQDIHDQIVVSNEKLLAIDEGFAKVERANQLLEDLDAQLATLDSIDGNLTTINSRLDTLEGDLKAVSEHLASLRKTINNIDSTIPFLKLSGDDEEAQDALESGETPEDGTDPATAPTTEEDTQPPATQPASPPAEKPAE